MYFEIDHGREAVEVLHQHGLDELRVFGDDGGIGAVVAAVRLAELLKLGLVEVVVGL